MRLAVRIGVALAAVGTSALLIAATQTDSSGPVPAVTLDGNSFYAQDQVDEAWAWVTTNYPQPLATGDSFPVTAPAFFHPSDGQDDALYEQGLPAEIAAQYWRCSWLNQAIENQADTGSSAYQDAVQALANYDTLPGVDQSDASQYDAAVTQWAADYHESKFQADFDGACAVYTDAK